MYPTTLPHPVRRALWPRIHGYELGPHRLEFCQSRCGNDFAAFRLEANGEWSVIEVSADYYRVSEALDLEIRKLWQ